MGFEERSDETPPDGGANPLEGTLLRPERGTTKGKPSLRVFGGTQNGQATFSEV